MKHSKLLVVTLFLLLPLLLAGRIAIYSDTQYNDRVHSQIVQAIAEKSPDLAFLCGDLTSKGRSQEDYENWMRIAAPLLAIAPVYPARGNHDKDLGLFKSYFPIVGAEAYYTVEHDSLLFVILDSTQNMQPGSPQYLWLKTALKTELPTLLILHHPVFSSGMHGDELGLQLFLPALLKNSRVVAVFSGHDHHYERSLYQGISYIVNGGAGGKLRSKKNANPYRKVFRAKHHYLIGDRMGDKLNFQVFDLKGKRIDSFSLSLKPRS
ncbi:MAG TPA: metallophosphoesterase [Candidatus Cloacimonadota bacterium]|nr:metallophosphoesterase [Candidatus Cloacimonadota bacterium]